MRVTPNGTTLIEDMFIVDGLRVCRRASFGGPLEPMETVWLRTLDGRRVVGWWIKTRNVLSGTVAHFRDRGCDVLGPVELEALIAAARYRWPVYALRGR